jgi:hypothetical protein
VPVLLDAPLDRADVKAAQLGLFSQAALELGEAGKEAGPTTWSHLGSLQLLPSGNGPWFACTSCCCGLPAPNCGGAACWLLSRRERDDLAYRAADDALLAITGEPFIGSVVADDSDWLSRSKNAAAGDAQVVSGLVTEPGSGERWPCYRWQPTATIRG